MKALLLTFDIEQFIRPVELALDYDEDHLFEVGREGLEHILQLLKEVDSKATFFVTCEFAMRNKPLIKQLVKQGHELALHAYQHTDRYNLMNPEEALEKLRTAKKELEETFHVVIRGFRSPQLHFVDKEILKKIGITYDSSYHPTWIPGHYLHFFGTRKIFKENGITIVPISVAAGLKLPFSWLWFRLFGLTYAKICTKLALFRTGYINIYFHPWDFTDLQPYKNEIGGWYAKHTGSWTIKNMKKYINWCKSQGLQAMTLSTYLKHGS